MPSPFPGMDPYLEAPENWHGVHQKLISYLCDYLNERLPLPFAAVVEERCYVLESERDVVPDFAEVKHRFVNIIAVRDRELITTLEVLSPVNNRGEGREKYLKKQRDLLQSDIHLIEIDLLRSGEHTVAVPHEYLRRLGKPYSYLVGLSQAHRRHKAYCWPIRLEERLPTIRVPLTTEVDDIALDLQSVLDLVYDRGAYARLIDYHQLPTPRLSPSEQKWADTLIGNLPTVS